MKEQEPPEDIDWLQLSITMIAAALGGAVLAGWAAEHFGWFQ